MFWWNWFGPQGTAFRKNEDSWGPTVRGVIFPIPIMIIVIFLLARIM